MATFLVSDMIEETRRHLLGMHRAELNRLTASAAPGDTTLTFDFDLAGITRGAYLGVDDEIVYVWSTTPATKVAVVQRGMLGTSPGSHASGDVIEVNPRFARYAVRWALREEIRSWGPQLFQVKQVTINTTSNIRGYDLGALGQFYNVIDVRRQSLHSPGQPDPHSWPRLRNWRLLQSAPLSDFPSGNALTIADSFTQTGSGLPSIQVLYSAPFDVDTAFTDTTDLVANVGLDTGQMDIAPIGAAWRLLAPRDIQRTSPESQGQPADLQAVPAGYIASAAKSLKVIRDQRLSEEALQLRARYPYSGGA